MLVKDQNILNFIDDLDTLVAANFIITQMMRDPQIKPEERRELEKLVAENKNLLAWISKNFD